MIQRTHERVRRIELQLGVPPSHYESLSASPRAQGRPLTAEPRRRPRAGPNRRPSRRPPCLRRRPPGSRSPPASRSPRRSPTRRTRDGGHALGRRHRHRQHLRQVQRSQPGRTAAAARLRTQPRRPLRARPTRVRCSTSAAARASSRSAGPRCSSPRRVVGIDLDDPLLAAEWARRTAPNLTYLAQRAERLPFADGEFDLATAIEVLEHVPDPDHTLAEMARCAARHLLVSVPREPLWRAVNMARGAYWRAARQHAGPRQPLLQVGDRRALRAPRRGDRDTLAVPLDDGACPSLKAPRARRGLGPPARAPPTHAGRGCSRSGSPRPAS